jgi:hypothetical protein
MINHVSRQLRTRHATYPNGRLDICRYLILGTVTFLAALSGTDNASGTDRRPAPDFWGQLTALALSDQPPTVLELQRLERTTFVSSPAGQGRGTVYRGNVTVLGRTIQSSYYVFPDIWYITFDGMADPAYVIAGSSDTCVGRDRFVQILEDHGWQVNSRPYTQRDYDQMSGSRPPAISLRQRKVDAVVLLSLSGARCVNSFSLGRRWPNGLR